MSGPSEFARSADHRQPVLIALVALGGAIGTGLRAGLGLLLPPVHGIPWTTAGVNIVGAFLLGLLLEVLERRGDETAQRRRLRLFAGTGVLGGFTTYSALATDTVLLGGTASVPVAAAYAVGTVLIGGLATLLGILAGTRLQPRRPR